MAEGSEVPEHARRHMANRKTEIDVTPGATLEVHTKGRKTFDVSDKESVLFAQTQQVT